MSLLLIPASYLPQIAQPTESSPRERLIAKIRLDAQRDAESNRSKYSLTDLVSAYGEDSKAVGLTALEIKDLYEEAYNSRRDLLPFYVRYSPQAGWVFFFIAIIAFLFRRVWSDTVYPKIKEYNLALFNRLSGYGFFHSRALKKYRDRLEQRLSNFKPAIGKGELELEMKTVYVPLQVLDREVHAGRKPLGALEAISAYGRMMVTGKPGSGKSMLLKSYALSFVEALKQPPSQPKVPVIYELRRHNENDAPLLEQLVLLFEENGFKNARNFILNNLERGSLLMLFDGLDEVNSGKRVEVVENIKNFLRLYDKCWVVITCRTAVYNKEFNDVVNQSLEIEPFSDRDIQEFLSTWKNMPPQKSATQLYLAINERPKIKELARNPLLLTMIAFLYTSQAFELPYSRAEFYHQAVELLLSLSKLRNQPIKFRAEEKRLVLGHLALFNQNSGALGDQDRISIDLKTVIQEIQKVLPSLGRDQVDATIILE
ncbi:MAG TPA: NACHT domain-containing protein, partial [Chlamydiales bacterium]|nr:NACHT domain-containing protein [Chlamydiales bacterium]